MTIDGVTSMVPDRRCKAVRVSDMRVPQNTWHFGGMWREIAVILRNSRVGDYNTGYGEDKRMGVKNKKSRSIKRIFSSPEPDLSPLYSMDCTGISSRTPSIIHELPRTFPQLCGYIPNNSDDIYSTHEGTTLSLTHDPEKISSDKNESCLK